MVSGCTSSDSGSTGSGIKTAKYNPDTGITSGQTKDGYGYAYDKEGRVAVSDGKDAAVYDPKTDKVYTT